LATFQSFAAKTQLSTLNLDAAPLELNMRLLALCAGAVTKEKMTYGEIAAAMQVPVDDVEIWVVTAIAEGVLEGTLDQTTSTLTIARCSYRSFGVEQWKDVQKKLTQLRQHIASVFDEMNRK
jgi:translation initiation factor 3 subunit M